MPTGVGVFLNWRVVTVLVGFPDDGLLVQKGRWCSLGCDLRECLEGKSVEENNVFFSCVFVCC